MNRNIYTPKQGWLMASLCCLVIGGLSSNAYAKEFKVKYENLLAADGAGVGEDSYTLIKNAFGEKSIESPDLYKSNNTSFIHIQEGYDEMVGNHFVFYSDLENDKDRDKGKTDRQRNEIKIYDHSSSELQGFKKETMQYRWKFKIEDDFEFSKSFTHFFQIKAKNVSGKNSKNGGESYPLITLTVVERGNGENEFQLRHNSGFDKEGNKTHTEKLQRKNLSLITGKWVEIFIQATYKDKGNLVFQIKDVETGETIVDYKNDKLDLWRGEGKEDFSRPKWGIYRSLKDKESLRSEIEIARFADFSIKKGKLK